MVVGIWKYSAIVWLNAALTIQHDQKHSDPTFQL